MFCPLTGKPCQNPKFIEVCESVNGQVSFMNLCEGCACHVEKLTGGQILDPTSLFGSSEPKNLPLPQPFGKKPPQKEPEPMISLFNLPLTSPQNSLSGPLAFFANLIQQVEKHHNAEDQLMPPCPSCGSTLTSIYQKGKLGCPHCYAFFKQQVVPILKQAHEGNTQHNGKMPSASKDDNAENERKANELTMIQASLNDLEKELANMIKNEQYEDAIKVRDKIKYLKSIIKT